MKTFALILISALGLLILALHSDNFLPINKTYADEDIPIDSRPISKPAPDVAPAGEAIRDGCNPPEYEPFYEFKIDHDIENHLYYLMDKRNNKIISSGYNSLEIDSDDREIVYGVVFKSSFDDPFLSPAREEHHTLAVCIDNFGNVKVKLLLAFTI